MAAALRFELETAPRSGGVSSSLKERLQIEIDENMRFSLLPRIIFFDFLVFWIREFFIFHYFNRYGSVHFDGTVLKGKLVDMPCIVDVLKTIDKKTFYKTGNISQVRFYTQFFIFIYSCKL